MKFAVIYPTDPMDGPDVVTVQVDARDTWHPNTVIAYMALPLLQQFRAATTGYPVAMTYEEWVACLDEMIWAFQTIVDASKDRTLSQDEWDRVQRAMELFGKHFLHLWD